MKRFVLCLKYQDHVCPFFINNTLTSFVIQIGSEGVSPLPRGNGYLGSELQALPVRVPGDCTMPSSSFASLFSSLIM